MNTLSGKAKGLGNWLGALVLCATLLSGCATAPKPQGPDLTPRVAVMSAFAPELDLLRRETQVTQVRVINGRTYYLGRLAGQDVVLVLSGMSMVNASMTAQTLLDHFAVREIVFSGIAGGVNPNLNIGDVAVPAQWGQYQEQVFARQTAAGGWDPGQFHSLFPNYGMMFPQNVQVPRPGTGADQWEERFWFPCDAKGLEVARRLAPTVRLSRRTAQGDSLASEPKIVVGGNGVSGQAFVDNAAYRQWAWETFHADALDMETAAVGMVAYVHRVPYIAFRSLSDLAGGGKGENEQAVFFKLAADNSAAVVMAYLRALGQDPEAGAALPAHRPE